MKITRYTPLDFSCQLLLTFIISLMASTAVSAQETRSTLLGTVRDSAGAVVTGANVIITNTETNTVTNLTTNSSGYFEAGYLLPGTYNLSTSAQGFKTVIQQGIVLTVNSRINIDVTLDIGTTSEQVTVTAAAQMLETTSGSGSATLEQRQVMDLPVFGNSALLLARSVPGIQWTGQPNFLGLHSNVGASAVNAAGGIGGTEFALDGVPNLGGGRRVGYLPYTDTVSEVKIETAPFDASKGHSSGASISMISKSGTNEYHGTLTWQHWQQRLNATQSTTNAAYWGRIKGASDPAVADRLRQEERQFPGRSNNWAGVIGGPVRIPKLYDGRDRLFFFFSYNGIKDAKSEEPTAVNRTVPTEAQRRGDFSDLLRIDSNRYQIYDPRTARCSDGMRDSCDRPGVTVIRDPFPNNQVPILNPLYNFYLRLYPLPNNVPGVVSREGQNNYLAPATAFSWNYKAFSNRVDFQLSPKQRMFGRWSYNDFLEDRGDWVYETSRGMLVNGLVRKNVGITFDHVYTFNSTTIFNWSVAWNRFTEGSVSNDVQTSFPPSAVGLPGYLDQKAGQYIHLPTIRFGAYSSFDRGYPGFTRFSVGTVRGELSKYFGTHSLRMGVDLRENWRAAFNPGQTSSEYTFNNNFVRRADNTTNAGALGLEWAAFMLGVPSGVGVSTNDSLYLTNKYYGSYIQDDWKVNNRLTLNFGLRYELEGGFHERFNRGVAGFDPAAELPIAAAAQAAYAARPLAERPAGDFTVRGGSIMLGKDGGPDTVNDAKGGWMPRVGFAFKINEKTVLRGGYGLFYDTINVLNEGLDASGFSRGTGTTITNDRGRTFNFTNLTPPYGASSNGCTTDISQCTTIFADPFPVRANGSRFVTPPGNQLGFMTEVGRAFGFVDRDWERARQQRWRLGIQREVGRNMVAEVAYLGSYSDQLVVTRRLDFLPEQYWASGLIRNNAIANNLNSSVPNPFLITNFEFLKTSNPLLYEDMSNNGFFTGRTRNKHNLLRAFPHMSTGDGLRNSRVPDGKSKYNHLEASITRRMSQGYSFTVGYTWTSNMAKTTRLNEFDEDMVWTPSNNSTPHHLLTNFIYELPFGKGKKLLSGNKWLGAVFGGWQVGGIYHLQSGRVYGLGNWFYYGDDLRAIALDPDKRSTDAWFNWQLFPGASRDFSSSNRAAYEARIRSLVPESVIQQMGNICGSGNNQPCTYSNVTPTNFQPNSFHRRIFPTNLNWLRGHRMSQFDTNIIRRFGIAEKKSLEFRVDFINAFNRVQWDLPNTDINSSNFGKLTTQWNTPRWIQFQLRLAF